jgi:superfamily II RNA helicase
MQVYFEIQARYSKNYRSDSEHLMGIFCSAWRDHHLECQLLVVEPNCLEMLMLEPGYASWIGKVRHIIFDEIHSVGLAGGEVWERMLLYTDVPLLGLSATLGGVDRFHEWLHGIEEQRGRKLHLVVHNERYNDLCPYVWTDRESQEDQIVPLHPCWAALKRLDSKQRWEFPSDFKLLPEDCVRLRDAMAASDGDSEATKALAPEQFFSERVSDATFNVSMRDTKAWEASVKARFCELSFDVQRASLDLISKESEAACRQVEGQLEKRSEIQYLYENMLPMIRSLQRAEMLPCIVFHMQRKNCERFAERIAEMLRKEEEAEQERDGHAKEVQKQEKKVNDIERALEKMGWSRDKEGEEPTEDQKEVIQSLDQARNKLAKLQAVDPRFALIPPGQTQLTEQEINDVAGRHNFFNPKRALHRALLRGVAAHHAGLPRAYHMTVCRLFRMRRLAVVISTETLAMGINMPTKTSVFAGDAVFLNGMNYRQMAGRAGRRGFDLRGNIVFMGLRRYKVQKLMNSELPTLSGNVLLSSSGALRMLIKQVGSIEI